MVRHCWGFLRTMGRDYGQAGYPWRELGRDFNPHLRCLLMTPALVTRVVLFETRAQARAYASIKDERGHPVRVTVHVVIQGEER